MRRPASRANEELNPAIRVLALGHDFDGARALLKTSRKTARARPQTTQLLATERFLDGTEAIFSRRDLKQAIPLLTDARDADPDPQITYVLAQAQLANDDRKGAQETLASLLKQKRGNIFLDSFACLLPLAEKWSTHFVKPVVRATDRRYPSAPSACSSESSKSNLKRAAWRSSSLNSGRNLSRQT